MGDKAPSRRDLARHAEVPVVPGTTGSGHSLEAALDVAH